MKSFVKKTMVTGLFLLLPSFFLFYALINSFEILRKIVEPLGEKLGVDRVAGMVLLNTLTIIALLVVIFCLGLLAYLPAISIRVGKLDNLLTDRVPGYSLFKGIVGGAVQHDTSVAGMQSVLVRYNSVAKIGFEIERSMKGGVIVFLPNAPNPQTGTTAAFEPEDVEQLDIPPHKLLEMMNFYGKGINEAVELARKQRLGKRS